MKNLKFSFLALCMSAIFGGKAVAQVPSYVPANGLVGWWPFNGNANDESGNGNNGTVNGATLTTDRFGGMNNAYNFNGISNYIDVGNPSSLGNNPSNYTQAGWVYLVDFSDAYVFMSKRHDNSGNDWGTPVSTVNGTFIFFADDAFYQQAPLAETNQLSVNQWYQLTFVKNQNTYSIYVNGVLDGSITDNHIMGGTSNNIIFGAQLAWPEFFKGKLDDIGIWNRALTPQEITDLYNGCSSSMITAQPTNQAVNPTNAAQFVASSNSGSTFQWQTDLGVGFQNLSNAGQYSGVNNDTLVVSNASVSNNNQQFRCIVNSGSCVDTSDIAVLTVSSVGIEEMMNQVNFNLFPNPTQSSFEIQTNLVYTKIQLRDMQGRIVKTENVGKIINIASLQKGTYLVQLLDEKSKLVAVQRVIKE